MAKSFAWVFAGAILATVGVSHAQEAPAPITSPAQAERLGAELPWYQRFTSSTGLTESLHGSDSTPAPVWTPSRRWGVTVDVREGERIQRGPESGREDQAAVGAYYQFTPRVRVGGEVSVGAAQRDVPVVGQSDTDETAAGVRIGSAFRF